jgi:hypothetical protein
MHLLSIYVANKHVLEQKDMDHSPRIYFFIFILCRGPFFCIKIGWPEATGRRVTHPSM